MYTIKEAAARAGVTIPVLRAWERRYGVVSPPRTTAGYRLYDDAAVERLRTMRRLVGTGWRPSIAARAVMEQWPEAIPGTVAIPPARSMETEAPRPTVAARLAERFIDSAAALDEAAVEEVVDEMLMTASFETAVARLLFPALEALGDAWERGALGVDAEHMASHVVLRRLGEALQAAGPGTEVRGGVLVGLPPGSRHELGALAFAVLARRAGLPVTYLGPDLPADDWVHAARGAIAVVIGVVTASDVSGAAEVVSRLRATQPGLIVALGGRSAEPLEGVVQLPVELGPAVGRLRELLPAAVTRPG